MRFSRLTCAILRNTPGEWRVCKALVRLLHSNDSATPACGSKRTVFRLSAHVCMHLRAHTHTVSRRRWLDGRRAHKLCERTRVGFE
jgi:hypothetical protein